MTSLRILGGEFKGRPLRSPKNSPTRPTQGIVRQAVFNICQQQIADSRFLDLFAGSGAMGLEALSHGARHATFVEQNRSAAQCLQENIKILDVGGRSRLLTMSVAKALSLLAKEGQVFDIVYIDPPYDIAAQIISDVLQTLETSALLASDASVFFEESSLDAEPVFDTKRLIKKNTRRFGIARLHQFRLDRT